MNKPEFTPSQETAPIERAGTFSLSQQEAEKLALETSRQHEPHPSLAGVEIRAIGIEELPSEIAKLIASLGGEPTSFSSVRIGESVPKHQHIADNEIYFGGMNIGVTLFDSNGIETAVVALGEKSFAVTLLGESHSAQTADSRSGSFFGAKFITKP